MRAKSNMETEESTRYNPNKGNAELRQANVRIGMDEPKWRRSVIITDAPRKERLRRNIVNPSVTESETNMSDSMRAKPNNANAKPT